MKIRVHVFEKVRHAFEFEADSIEDGLKKLDDELDATLGNWLESEGVREFSDEVCIDPLKEDGGVDYEKIHLVHTRPSWGLRSAVGWGMKTLYVCRECGCPDIVHRCGKLINEGDLLVEYESYWCGKCRAEGNGENLIEVLAPDDFCVYSDLWSFEGGVWKPVKGGE